MKPTTDTSDWALTLHGGLIASLAVGSGTRRTSYSLPIAPPAPYAALLVNLQCSGRTRVPLFARYSVTVGAFTEITASSAPLIRTYSPVATSVQYTCVLPNAVSAQSGTVEIVLENVASATTMTISIVSLPSVPNVLVRPDGRCHGMGTKSSYYQSATGTTNLPVTVPPSGVYVISGLFVASPGKDVVLQGTVNGSLYTLFSITSSSSFAGSVTMPAGGLALDAGRSVHVGISGGSSSSVASVLLYYDVM